MPKPRLKPIKIVERHMSDAYGKAWAEERLIWLDPPMSPRKRLETLLHEVHHIEIPDLAEEAVIRNSRSQRDALTRDGWRRCTCGKCSCNHEDDE